MTHDDALMLIALIGSLRYIGAAMVCALLYIGGRIRIATRKDGA